MRILVTGGAGFIGSHVADAFLAAGHEVAIIDNLSGGSRANVPERARFEQLDIRDKGLALEFCQQFRPEVICHHAAQVDVRRSVVDPGLDADINIGGTLNLLEAGRTVEVAKIIFASSGGAIYGEQEGFPAPETHPQNPVSPYGVSKLAGEKYLNYYRQVHGLPYVSLRYANVYGPRQDPFGEAGVVAIFTSRLLRGEQPVINGDGRQTRDYVYAADVARANLLALAPEVEGAFNIATGVETDVITLFEEINRLVGTQAVKVFGPAKPGEQRRSVLDIALARDTLGWRPEVALAEGLRQTVDHFRAAAGRQGA